MPDLCSRSLLLLGLGVPGLLAQIGQGPGSYPPIYPGGGVGGISVPRRAHKTKSVADDLLQEYRGTLRSLTSRDLEIETEEAGVIKFQRNEKTEFLKGSDPIPADRFRPGDTVLVDARSEAKPAAKSDEKSGARPALIAVQIFLEKSAAASAARPTGRNKTTAAAPAAAGKTAPPAAVPEPEDPDDPGRPVLRYGGPARRHREETSQTTAVYTGTPAPLDRVPANAAPPASASVSPAPTVETPRAAPADPVEEARLAALNFTETLPDYVCRQVISRMVSTTIKTDWQPEDVVTADVVFEGGKESYRNLAINGKQINKKMDELSGAWSTGEFGTMLLDLFARSTAAEFHYRRESTIANRQARVYDFSVAKGHSHWKIMAPQQWVEPAYAGSIWIDHETNRVLRIEMQATGLPREFPLDRVETAVDYDFVLLTEKKFLLPVHAETLSCQRDSSNCSRNVIDFRNYHKFAGESTITFEKSKE